MKWTALYFKRGDTEALNSQIKQPFIKAQRNEHFIYNLSASLSFFWHTFLGLIAKEQRNSMMQSYQALLEQMSGQKRQTIDRLLKRSSNSTSSPGCIQLRCMGSGHQGKRKLTATMLRYDVRFKQSWCHWHRKGNSKKKRKCSLTCQAIQWAWVFFAEVKEHLCFLPTSQYNWVRLSCLMLRALKICDINRTEAFHLFPEAETYHTISGFHLDWCFYTVLKTVQREVWELG